MTVLVSMTQRQVTAAVFGIYILIAVLVYFGLSIAFRASRNEFRGGEAVFILSASFMWPATIILFLGALLIEITQKFIQK